MSIEDTTAVEFYAPWPNLGKKFSQQLGDIRTDTAHLSPLIRGMGLDADGDFSTLDGIEQNAIQSREWGQKGFHNRFRMHYNKTSNLLDFAYNTGTEQVPNWYTTWTLSDDGFVTQQNTPTTASNLASGPHIEGVFFQKSGVDLQFKSLEVFYPLTIDSSNIKVTLRSGAEANTYSSVTPSVSSGGTGGIESILADSGKVGVDFPFKAFEAGPNAVITDTGNTIRFESTAQVVEFYGIVVQHSDGTAVFPGVHIFKVNPEAFYLTKQIRSNEVLLNSRGDNLRRDEFVETAGDVMTGPLLQADGTAAAPSFTFTGDSDTGMRLRADADLAFPVAGTDRLRIQNDLILTAVPIQITNAGTAASPDYGFFPDIDTGIYQLAADDNSIAFTTGGNPAGHFSDGRFFTSNVNAGVGYFYEGVVLEVGTIAAPSLSFIGYPTTGIYKRHATRDQLSFVTDGVEAGYFNHNQKLVVVDEIHAGDGDTISGETVSICAYSFIATGQQDVGMYRSGPDELSFATGGIRAGYFDISQDFQVRGQIVCHDAGGEAKPEFSFAGQTDMGMYEKANDELGFSVNGATSAYFQLTNLYIGSSDTVGTIRLPDGTAGAPSYTFRNVSPAQTDVGMYRSGTDEISFAVGGNRILKIAADHVAADKQIRGDTSGTSVSNVAFGFDNDIDSGMYQRLGLATDRGLLAFAVAGQQVARVSELAPVIGQWQFNNTIIGDDGIDILNDVRAGRVHAGPSVFYASGAAIALEVAGRLRVGNKDGVSNFTTPQITFNGGGEADDSGFGFAHAASTQYPFITTDGVLMMFFKDYIGNSVVQRLWSGGTALLPSLVFAGDTNTGIWQSTSDRDRINFATAGVNAGYFDSSQNFHVTNDIIAGGNIVHQGEAHFAKIVAGRAMFYVTLDMGTADAGTVGANTSIIYAGGDSATPGYSWVGDPDTGIAHGGSANTMLFRTGNANRFKLDAGGITMFKALELDTATTAAVPALSFDQDTNTGIYQNAASDDSIAFTTGGIRAGYFDSGQDLYVTNEILAPRITTGFGAFYVEATAGRFLAKKNSATQSTGIGYGFVDQPLTGMMLDGVGDLRLVVDGNDRIAFQSAIIPLVVTQTNTVGTAAAPTYSWFNDKNTGLYQNATGDDSIAFSTAGTRAGYFDSGQDLYVTNDLRSGRVEAGPALFYGQVRFEGGDMTHILLGQDDQATHLGNPQIAFASEVASGGTGFGYNESNGTVFVGYRGAAKQWWFTTYNRMLQPTRFEDGSASAPSILYQSDTNTGLFRKGTDQFAFTTGGVEAGFFDAQQNLIVTNSIRAGNDIRANAFYLGTHNAGMFTDAIDNLILDGGSKNVRLGDKAVGTIGVILGSELDTNSFDITSTSIRDITLRPQGNGAIILNNSAGTGDIKLDAGTRILLETFNNKDILLTAAGNVALNSDKSLELVSVSRGVNIEAASTYQVNFNRPLQSLFTDSAGAPSYSWGIDTNTGLYNTDEDDTISFSTGGVRAGFFDSGQDFHVTNEILVPRITAGRGEFYEQVLVGVGRVGRPALAFNNYLTTGIYSKGSNQIDFAVKGIERFVIGEGIHTSGVRMQFPDGSEGSPSILNTGDTDTGIYFPAANQVGFTTGGTEAGHFDSGQNLFVTNYVKAEAFYLAEDAGISIDSSGNLELSAGANGISALGTILCRADAFTPTPISIGPIDQTNTGIAFDGVTTRFINNGSQVFVLSTALVRTGVAHQFLDGTAGAPSLTFTNEIDTGMYNPATDKLAFSTGGVEAGYFDSSQDFTSTNHIFTAQGLVGSPSYSFTDDTDTGMYLDGVGDLRFVVGGVSVLACQVTSNFIPLVEVYSNVTGTAGAPSYAWNNDRDTGIYQNAQGDDSIAFSTGGTRAGHFDKFQNFYVANSVYVKDVIEADKAQFYTSLSLNDSKMKFASDGMLYAWDPTRLKFLSVARPIIHFGRNGSFTVDAWMSSSGGGITTSNGSTAFEGFRDFTVLNMIAQSENVTTAAIDIALMTGTRSTEPGTTIKTITIPTAGTRNSERAFDLDIDVDKGDWMLAESRASGTGGSIIDPTLQVEIAWHLK